MLGVGEKDTFSPAPAPGLLLVIALVRVLCASALYSSYGYLRLLNYPSLYYSFLVVFLTAIILVAARRPWEKKLQSAHISKLFIVGVLYALQSTLFFVGVKYFGPLRALIYTEYGHLIYVYGAGTAFDVTRKQMTISRIRGVLLCLGAYALLFFDFPAKIMSLPSTAVEGFEFGLLHISANKFGAICAFLSTIVSIARRNMARNLASHMGGPKQTHCLVVCTAAAVLFPFGLASYVFSGPTRSTGSSLHFFESWIYVVLVTGIADHYAQTMGQARVKIPTLARLSVFASIGGALVFEILWGADGVMTYLTCTALLFFGIGVYLTFHVAQQPSFNRMGTLGGGGGGYVDSDSLYEIVMPLLSEVSRRIRNDKDARHIFYYLCINLSFMFVELLYGVWNNSLGLVSDAFHMLFDCIALLIGLCGLVIAEWTPNKRYTYGYGRVNLMSAFINAVFLVFIAVEVSTEAIHRFFDPPEVETQRLLLVSVLGLLVNIVGLFVFHQAHAAAHGHSHGGGGHGHSHGGGHSHSHGHGHGHGHGDECGDEEEEHDGHEENLEGVFLHILGDTLGSVGVIISSLFVQFFGWQIADPICSFCLAIIILLSCLPLLRSSAWTLLHRMPKKFSGGKLRDCLNRINMLHGVVGYSNVRLFALEGTASVASLHLQVHQDANAQLILSQATQIFTQAAIKNVTIQVERGGSAGSFEETSSHHHHHAVTLLS